MTNREFLTAIASNETLPTDVREHAQAAIAKLDNALASRKNKPSKTAAENAPIKEQILTDILGATPMGASEVAEAAGISTQKASALLRQLVAEGKATVSESKVPKKGTIKVYAIASGETAVDAE